MLDCFMDTSKAFGTMNHYSLFTRVVGEGTLCSPDLTFVRWNSSTLYLSPSIGSPTPFFGDPLFVIIQGENMHKDRSWW